VKRGCDLLIFQSQIKRSQPSAAPTERFCGEGIYPRSSAQHWQDWLQMNDRGTPTQVNAPPSALGVYSPRPFSRVRAGDAQWIQPY
jgi:hypothetical protein